MKARTLPLLLALLAGCASVDYRSPAFEQRAAGHRSIAVLPFEMVFTGKAPRGLTAEQILAIEEAESVAFQRALYHRLLRRSSADRRRPILVRIQPAEQTGRLLAEHSIPIRESWAMTPDALADLLGVDAVVRTTVYKTRYLSDLASFGLEVAWDVLLHELSDGEIQLLPVGMVKTHDIRAESAVLDGRDGQPLWQIAVERQADWTRGTDAVIDGITKRLARKFPYRG